MSEHYTLYWDFIDNIESYLKEYEILSDEFNRKNYEERDYLVELGQLNYEFVIDEGKKINKKFYRKCLEIVLYNSLHHPESNINSISNVINKIKDDDNACSYVNRLKTAIEILNTLIFNPNDDTYDELNKGFISSYREVRDIIDDDNEEEICII